MDYLDEADFMPDYQEEVEVVQGQENGTDSLPVARSSPSLPASKDSTTARTKKARTTSFEIAVAIVPPERCMTPIQEIQKRYDKDYHTAVPHIRLLTHTSQTDDMHVAGISQKAGLMSYHLGTNSDLCKRFSIEFTKESIQYCVMGESTVIYLTPFSAKEIEELSDEVGEKQSDDSSQRHKRKRKRQSRWDKLEDTLQRRASWEFRAEETLQSYSPIPAKFRCLPAPSLSSLTDAIWRDEDIKEDRSWKRGLDSLREEDANHAQDTYRNITSNLLPQVSDNTNTRIEKKFCNNVITHNHKTRMELAGNCTISSSHHLEKLQEVLCTKVFSNVVGGTSPEPSWKRRAHLYLGCCKTQDADHIVASLRKKWETITFEIKEICLMTRNCNSDSFRIEQAIPLQWSNHRLRQMTKDLRYS